MQIRKANPDDARAVAIVQVDSWQTTYKNIVPDAYLKQMTYENRTLQWQDNILKQTVFVAENEKGEIVGFSAVGKERTDKYADYHGELYAIYILKTSQNLGIGRLLFEAANQHLQDIGIFSMIVKVLDKNESKRFYEYLGAKRIDCFKIKVMNKTLDELVYGWKDTRRMNR